MNGTCEVCSKAGKLGNGIRVTRVEGTVITLCRKCEDNLKEDKPVTKTRSLLDSLRWKK